MRRHVGTLEEDFRAMGLSSGDVRRARANMIGESVEDPNMDEGQNDDSPEDILEAYKKVKRATGSVKAKRKRAAKKYYRSHKGKIKSKMKRARKTSAWKMRQAKLSKMGKAKKGYRRIVPGLKKLVKRIRSIGKRVFSDRDYSGQNSLLESMFSLVEGIDRDPVSRFNQYVEAFNHIADIGELMTLQYHGLEESELAEDSIDLAVISEEALKVMEDFGGAVTPDQDEMMEEVLSELIDYLSESLDTWAEMNEEDGEEMDDEEEEYDDEEEDGEDEDEDEGDEDEEYEEEVEDDDRPF